MECSYCSQDISRGSGKMLIKNSGEKVYFCSSKCEKNWQNNRNLEYSEHDE